MLNHKNIDRYSKFIQYFLTITYILTFLRFIALSVDLGSLIGSSNDILVTIGQYLEIFKVILINITTPLVFPFNKIALIFFANADKEILDIVGPIFVILFILFLKILINILTPYVKYYFRNFD